MFLNTWEEPVFVDCMASCMLTFSAAVHQAHEIHHVYVAAMFLTFGNELKQNDSEKFINQII